MHQRISPLGLAIFVPAVIVGFAAPLIAAKCFPARREAAERILRSVSLALAMVGALILVDVIPV